MKHNSEDEQALIKIQHEWAEARLKRDSSFPQRIEADDFTVVWFNGTIVSKEEDLKSYESADTVFTDFKIDDLRSEEHTSELQSHHDLVCRLLLEKKKKKYIAFNKKTKKKKNQKDNK